MLINKKQSTFEIFQYKKTSR